MFETTLQSKITPFTWNTSDLMASLSNSVHEGFSRPLTYDAATRKSAVWTQVYKKQLLFEGRATQQQKIRLDT